MKTFVRNKKTGILEVWENGNKIGEIKTMGDAIIAKDKKERGKKKDNV